MNEPLHPALLPLGLRDVLPPDAAAEAQVVARLMAVLAGHGYERVKPPLGRVRGQSAERRRRRHGERDLPPDGPDLAAHDRRCAPT